MQMNNIGNIGFKGVLIKDKVVNGKPVTLEKVQKDASTAIPELNCKDLNTYKVQKEGIEVTTLPPKLAKQHLDSVIMSSDASLYIDLQKLGYKNLEFTGKFKEQTEQELPSMRESFKKATGGI